MGAADERPDAILETLSFYVQASLFEFPISSEGASVMSAESRRALLCVDLDGTLVATDTLDECLLCLLRHRPLMLLLLAVLAAGREGIFQGRVAAARAE